MAEELYEIKENQPETIDAVLPTVLDQQTQETLDLKVAIRYTTTIPADSPRISGVRRVYYDGTRYWLYIYVNGGWRRTVIGGVEFPTGLTHGDLLYVDSNGAIARLAAGTSGYYLKTLGTGQNPAWAALPDTSQLVANYTKVDTGIAAGDVVSLLEGGTQNIFIQDIYEADAEIGKQLNPNRAAIKFIAPIAITGFDVTIALKETGASTSDVDINLRSDSSGLPGTTLETQTVANGGITGTYANFTKTFTATLTPGTTYWITVEKQGSVDAANYYTTKVSSTFTFYSSGAVFDGSVWSSSNPLVCTISKSITAGLYRALDVPNDLGLQGGVKGIAKTVNSGDVDVVLSGVYTSSGTPYTAGVDYFLSASTAGGIATTGNMLLGRAQSTSKLDVISHKPMLLKLTGSFSFATSPANLKLMTGFRPRRMFAYSAISPKGSTGSAVGTSSAGIWSDQNTAWANTTLFNTNGGSGGTESGITINKSNIVFSISSSDATKAFTGTIICES